MEGEHAAPEDAQGGMHAPPADAPLGDTLSIREAADLLGKDASTIRRRIQRGEIAAYRRETAHGYEWRIPADGLGAPSPGVHTLHGAPLPGSQGMHVQEHAPPAALGSPELIKALEIVDRLQRDNQQLAGQVGYLQRQVIEQQETIQRLLVAPREPVDVTPGNPVVEPNASPAPEPRRSWWRRLFGDM